MLLLRVNPQDAAPIWRQIEEGLRHQVASGALAAGEAVPSVRDLARELVVNPATVVKAYQRLVDAGVLVVRRGEGTFVTDTPPSMGRAERRDVLREAATRYAAVAVTVGASLDEAGSELRAVMSKMSAAAERAGREREKAERPSEARITRIGVGDRS